MKGFGEMHRKMWNWLYQEVYRTYEDVTIVLRGVPGEASESLSALFKYRCLAYSFRVSNSVGPGWCIKICISKSVSR